MGLLAADDPVNQREKRFSSDILRIEISGPDQQNISLVDIPGLFHSKWL